jgi:hypothetical protein
MKPVPCASPRGSTAKVHLLFLLIANLPKDMRDFGYVKDNGVLTPALSHASMRRHAVFRP